MERCCRGSVHMAGRSSELGTAAGKGITTTGTVMWGDISPKPMLADQRFCCCPPRSCYRFAANALLHWHMYRRCGVHTWPTVLGHREMLMSFTTCSKMTSGQFSASMYPPLCPHSPKKPFDVECRDSTCNTGHCHGAPTRCPKPSTRCPMPARGRSSYAVSATPQLAAQCQGWHSAKA